MQEQSIGKLIQIIGPVLDIRFPDGHLPDLLNAIVIKDGDRTIVSEVAQ
ncbi:MAG: F0F1 ATP synthase subunit beta, partial [Clostridia bacterium]|nr:F0F1 ATP synthase subunit beta [Clostridia bacterium]